MHLRPLAVLAGLVLGLLVCGWGVATSIRPEWWGHNGARWWVGWTREPVRRLHGAALAIVGLGITLSGIAAALTSPAAAIPPPARIVELVGLGVVVLGGAALVATHPAPLDAAEERPPHAELPEFSTRTMISSLDLESPSPVAAVDATGPTVVAGTV